MREFFIVYFKNKNTSWSSEEFEYLEEAMKKYDLYPIAKLEKIVKVYLDSKSE